jgi:hypothetical protein
MTEVNTNVIVAGSQFAGFKNYRAVTFSAAYAGGTLLTGTYAQVTASTSLDNTNAVSEVQIQFSGLETFYRLAPGVIDVSYPTVGTAQYSIICNVYFIDTTLYIDSYIVNQTAGSVVVPAISFDCRAFLYIAPF